MFKKSLHIATAIIACSLFASQAQAVTQTIEWSFRTEGFGPVATKEFTSTGLPSGWDTGADSITLSGGVTNTDTVSNMVSISHSVQGDTTGVGVKADYGSGTFITSPTTIDNLNISTYEVLRIDLVAPLNFINTKNLTGTWAMSFKGLTPPNSTIIISSIIDPPFPLAIATTETIENATVLTSDVIDSASTVLLNTNRAADFSFLALDDNPVKQFLFVKQTGIITSQFQVSGLKFTYDDGLAESLVTTPEPGVLGLLGFSLLGLVFTRKSS